MELVKTVISQPSNSRPHRGAAQRKLVAAEDFSVEFFSNCNCALLVDQSNHRLAGVFYISESDISQFDAFDALPRQIREYQDSLCISIANTICRSITLSINQSSDSIINSNFETTRANLWSSFSMLTLCTGENFKQDFSEHHSLFFSNPQTKLQYHCISTILNSATKASSHSHLAYAAQQVISKMHDNEAELTSSSHNRPALRIV